MSFKEVVKLTGLEWHSGVRGSSPRSSTKFSMVYPEHSKAPRTLGVRTEQTQPDARLI